MGVGAALMDDSVVDKRSGFFVNHGAAIANAVFNATGLRVRHYPLTLDKCCTSCRRWRRRGIALRGAARRCTALLPCSMSAQKPSGP